MTADLDTLAEQAAIACMGHTVTRLPAVLRPYLERARDLGAAEATARAEARLAEVTEAARAYLDATSWTDGPEPTDPVALMRAGRALEAALKAEP